MRHQVEERWHPLAANPRHVGRSPRHQHQRLRRLPLEELPGDVGRKHLAAQVLAEGEMDARQVHRLGQRFLLQGEEDPEVLAFREGQRRGAVRLRPVGFQGRHALHQPRPAAGERRAAGEHGVRVGSLEKLAQFPHAADAGLLPQELLAVRRQVGQPRDIVVPPHFRAAMLEELTPLAAVVYVPGGVGRAAAEDPQQVLPEKLLQMRPQVGQIDRRGSRLGAEPDRAALQVHPQVVDRFGPEDGFQFQGVDQHLHPVGQLQGPAAFHVQHPQQPAAVPVVVNGNQVRVVVADDHQFRIDAVPFVKGPRQAEGRLVDEGPAGGLPQPAQGLVPIPPPRVRGAVARGDGHAVAQVLCEHGLFPEVAAFQDGLDQRAMVEFGRRQPFPDPPLRTGGVEPQEPVTVVEEVPGNRRRAGAKRRRLRCAGRGDTHCQGCASSMRAPVGSESGPASILPGASSRTL